MIIIYSRIRFMDGSSSDILILVFKNETKIWYMVVMDFSKKVFLNCVEKQFLKYLFSKFKFKCLIITIYTYITEQKNYHTKGYTYIFKNYVKSDFVLFIFDYLYFYSVTSLWLNKNLRKQWKDPCRKLQTTAQALVESDFPCWIIHRPHLPQNNISPLMLWVGVYHLLNSLPMGQDMGQPMG